MRDDLTLCITMGRRQEPLKQTLESLLSRYQFAHVIAINDFRDEPTNAMFRVLCPNGTLISLNSQLGHHGAVDHMYSLVTTPYIFHCEDDWEFDDSLDVDKAIDLLNSESSLSQVCFRRLSDCYLTPEEQTKAKRCDSKGASYFRLDDLHPQWHGYTFNPHVMARETWLKLGKFSQFKKERHISRMLRKQGRYTGYINPGPCHHIGGDISVSSKPSKFKKFKAIVRGLIKSNHA